MTNKSPRTPHDPDKPIGHKNPPKETQFKPGNAGGPGRPKGVTSYESLFKKIFSSKVPVTENGKRVSKPMGDALAKRGQQIALTGPHTAYFQMIDRYQKFADQESKKAKERRKFKPEYLDYNLNIIFVAIISKMIAYQEREDGAPLQPLEDECVEDLLGPWEFFLGEDGHIAGRRIKDEPDEIDC